MRRLEWHTSKRRTSFACIACIRSHTESRLNACGASRCSSTSNLTILKLRNRVCESTTSRPSKLRTRRSASRIANVISSRWGACAAESSMTIQESEGRMEDSMSECSTDEQQIWRRRRRTESVMSKCVACRISTCLVRFGDYVLSSHGPVVSRVSSKPMVRYSSVEPVACNKSRIAETDLGPDNEHERDTISTCTFAESIHETRGATSILREISRRLSLRADC